jgi:hypothetical protein
MGWRGQRVKYEGYDVTHAYDNAEGEKDRPQRD